MRVAHFTRKTFKGYKNKVTFGLGLLLAVSGIALGGFSAVRTVNAASSGDCDNNAIIYCGTGTDAGAPSRFISQVRTNDSKNGNHDLQPVYAYYGLEPADYDRFVKSARMGTLYRDGHMSVDGLTVAVNTNTIGRIADSQGNGYFTTPPINGKVYYGNTNDNAFAYGTQSIPVMALFDAKGALQFAVLTGCGNPVGFSSIPPTYACNDLQKNAVAGKLNAYTFSTAASAGQGATIAKVVYDFGDGSQQVTKTNPAEAVPHTYTKAGDFVAKVTVYVNLPGNQQVQVTSAMCQTVISVILPFYQCLQTTATLINGNDKYRYKISTTTKQGNGASLTKIAYYFGDGATAISPNGTLEHTYSKGGTYNVKAIAYFAVTGQNQVANTGGGCEIKVPVAVPTYTCTGMGVPIVDRVDQYKYSFTAYSAVSNGAALSNYVYNFGDGTKSAPITAENGATTHSYTKAGSYTAIVTVNFTRHGDTSVSSTSPKCQQKFNVITPLYVCLQLSGSVTDMTKNTYQFIASYQVQNNAVAQTADFTFGDGNTVSGVKPNGTAFTTSHSYTTAGSYNVTALLHFTANGQAVTAPTCKALASPAGVVQECKPNVPIGSPLCTPCQYDTTLPTDSPQCVSPAVLPNTGAGNVIAVSSAAALVAFMVYRQLLFRGHKAAFVAAERGTSPLPLGQPLDSDGPLRGTPLEPTHRRSFRRNRPF